MTVKKKNQFVVGLKKIIRKLKKTPPRVVVVRLSGVIRTGGGLGIGGASICAEGVEDDLVKAFDTNGAVAVALQINSPGGSPVQSELIYKRIRELSAEKKLPVFTFVEDVAASGGYFLACAGEEIYASGSSLVGSIGVIASGFGFVDVMKKVGVERRVYAQGENKSILDPYQPAKEKDKKIVFDAQKDIHELFKNIVRDSRGKKLKKKDEARLFSGEFWNGVKGKELGLVDDIGDLRSVMIGKYGKKVEFKKVAKPKGWLKRKLEGSVAAMVGGVADVVGDKLVWSRFV